MMSTTTTSALATSTVGKAVIPKANSSKLEGLKQCDDFMQFEHALRESRALDDKIIQALNNSIPTASFRDKVDVGSQCRDLLRSIDSTYGTRVSAINRCIGVSGAKVAALKEKGESIGQERVALRMLRNEIMVEDVIRSRTQEAFHAKCRDHYKPAT